MLISPHFWQIDSRALRKAGGRALRKAAICTLLCTASWPTLHAQTRAPDSSDASGLNSISGVSNGGWQQMQPCPEWLVDGGADAVTPTSRWHFSGSLATTLHYSHNPEHRPSIMGSLDRLVPGNGFCGMTLFTNSFGQPSTYIYVGQQWDKLLGNPNWYARLSGGLLYGYVGKYQNKVPYNYKGFSPGLIPSVGYRFNQQSSIQLMVLGTVGLMLAYGRNF